MTICGMLIVLIVSESVYQLNALSNMLSTFHYYVDIWDYDIVLCSIIVVLSR